MSLFFHLSTRSSLPLVTRHVARLAGWSLRSHRSSDSLPSSFTPRHSLATLVHAVRIGGRMTTEHGELRKEGPYRCNAPLPLILAPSVVSVPFLSAFGLESGSLHALRADCKERRGTRVTRAGRERTNLSLGSSSLRLSSTFLRSPHTLSLQLLVRLWAPFPCHSAPQAAATRWRVEWRERST